VLAAGAAALAAPSLAPSSSLAQVHHLAASATSCRTDHPIHFGAVKVAEEGRAPARNGRLRVQVFPAGQLGTGVEMDQQVSDGSLEFALDGPGQLGSWVRTLTVFEAPFISPRLGSSGEDDQQRLGQGRKFRTLATPAPDADGRAGLVLRQRRQLTTRDRGGARAGGRRAASRSA